jgi:transposase
METIRMSQRELSRAVALGLVAEGKWTVRQAAEQMGLSDRQARRLSRRFDQDGAAGIAHRSRGRPAANRLAAEVRHRVLELVGDRYGGFNDTHLREALVEREGIAIGRETLRRLLRSQGIAAKRRRRPRKHRRRRDPSPNRGQMVQWDGSTHHWVGDNGPRWSLLAGVDDADGTAAHALFAPSESSLSYLQLLAGMVDRVGIPLSVYQDQHGALVRSDGHWSLEEQLRGEQDPTQVGAALRDLGIRPILARSPQGKGRIERFFGVAQDRLSAELIVRGITTLEAANQYLQGEWIDDFNRRFADQPAAPEILYRSCKHLDLHKILALRYQRTVAADNTVRLGDLTVQIPPGPRHRSYAKARVDVRQHLDGSWSVYYQDHRIAHHPATTSAEPFRARLRTSRYRHTKGAQQTILVYFQEPV